MSYHHINRNHPSGGGYIYFITIGSNNYLRINVHRMNIRKGKVYHYYCLFKKGLIVEEIYSTYKQNKQRCGRKERVLSKRS